MMIGKALGGYDGQIRDRFPHGWQLPSAGRIVVHPDQGEERGWFAGAPKVAIEVTSRGNTKAELKRKKEIYFG